MSTAKASPNADPAEIRRAIEVLFEPGDVIEVRIPNAGRERTCSGYFDDFDLMTRALAHWSGKAPGIYYTLNPLKRELLARAENKIKSQARETTSDADIVYRRWILIDCDPTRPAGISSTDPEHELALERARDIRLVLREEKRWPEPLLADSGNGGHLLYRLPGLPNDESARQLIESILKALGASF